MNRAASTGKTDRTHSPSPFQGEGKGEGENVTQAPVPAPGTPATGEDAPLMRTFSPEGRGGDGPTARSRAAALIVLPVLVLGAALLAHTLTGDLVRGEPARRLGSRSGFGAAPAPGTPAAVRGDERRQGAEARPPCGCSTDDVRAPAAGAPEAGMTGREWAERLAGGGHDDPIGPPPGAKRLFRLAGGYTFYRLPAGAPAERIREAVDHYRRTLADAGWETFVDRASEKAVSPPGVRASDRVSGNASRPATGHLLIAERDGRTVHIFVHEHQGTVRVVVRGERDR